MGSTEFRLLGPVEVRIGDRRIDIGHARQRSVLAVLLVAVNTVVPLGRVIERVWGDDAPATATDLVYGYVSRIRHRLAGAVRLERVPGGYRLDADPDSVDLHMFRRMVAQARASADDAQAAALLASALDLWRGTALTGVASPWLEGLQLTLEHDRLAAVLDHSEVRLRLGQDADVLGELREAVTRQPFDERAAGLFMRAAHRSGRRAEALGCYHQLRRRLAKELGVEPGRQLQELFQRFLRDDPSLAQPRGRDLRLPQRTPAQLPHDVASFAGRAAELAVLDGLLAGTACPSRRAAVISVVDGVAGVGKTALAIHWAHRVIGQFPDGQLFADLRGYDARGPLPAGEILGQFLRALGMDSRDIPTGADEQAALYRSLLTGKRVLVVLDNVLSSDQARPLLPGHAGCLVVVTSRNQLTGLMARDGAIRLSLDVLADGDACELLAKIVGADRAAADPQGAADLARTCGYLPLALCIAAEHVAAQHYMKLADLAASLSDEHARLDILDRSESSTAIRAALSWSYQALPPGAARIFRLLGLHATPVISALAAASLAHTTVQQARSDLATLVRGHLLEEAGCDRYRLHDLLHLYAAERASEEEEQTDCQAAVRRVLNWYLHTADRANHLLLPQRLRVPLDPPAAGCAPLVFTGYDAALRWCDAECANLVAATCQAARLGVHELAWKLPIALLDYFYLRKCWNEWTGASEYGLAAARQGGDGFGEAALLTSLGIAHYDFQMYPAAISRLQQALTVWRAVGFPAGESVTLPALGAAYRDTGRLDEAVDCLQRSRLISREIGDRWSEAMAIHNLGDTYRQLGKHPLAIELLDQAVIIRRAIKDRYGEAWTLHDLGAAYRDRRQLADAIGCFELALRIRTDLGDRHGQARTLRRLGLAYQETGRGADARSCWRDALALFEELGDLRADDLRRQLAAAEEDLGSPR